MRIAYITYEFPPDSSFGGIATYVAQAARIMANRRHEVEVFASSPHRFGPLDQNGVTVHWIRETHRVNFGIIAGHLFAARHSERPFDVLEGPEYFAEARKAVELVPQIPLVVKMHTPTLMVESLSWPSGLGLLWDSVKHNLGNSYRFLFKRNALPPFSFVPRYVRAAREMDAMESAHARQAVIVAPPCRDLCEHAKSIWNVRQEAIRLAPHPYVPTDDFLDIPPKAGGLTVGFVGRLERRKGIETLAAAIPAVAEAVPDATFRFIGAPCNQSTRRRYDEWIRHKVPECASKLEFLGKVPLEKMAGAYGSLNICVFPSLWENFPNVCLEGMAAARAIIASSAGGMAEMLDHGRAGRLFAPGDSAALAREIIALLRDPAERIRLGVLARKRVLETYNESVIGSMMERIYCEAIQRKADARANKTGLLVSPSPRLSS